LQHFIEVFVASVLPQQGFPSPQQAFPPQHPPSFALASGFSHFIPLPQQPAPSFPPQQLAASLSSVPFAWWQHPAPVSDALSQHAHCAFGAGVVLCAGSFGAAVCAQVLTLSASKKAIILNFIKSPLQKISEIHGLISLCFQPA